MRREPSLMFGSPAKAAAAPQAETPGNYLEFYGLSKAPFGDPDANAGYILFNSHRRTFELLVDHLVNGHGLVVLRGEEGTGKSQMLAAAGNLAVDSGLRVIKPTPPAIGPLDVPRLVAAILGRPENGTANADIGAAIRSFIAPPRAVLLIDDGNRLTADCIAALAAVVQQSTDNQAVVVTTPVEDRNNAAFATLARLARTELRIPRLNAAEIRQYIERSLWVAGGTTRRLVAPDALRMIVARSNGRPGSIDRLMEATFTAGFARGESLITAKTVTTILTSSAGRKRTDRPGRAGTVAQVMAVGLLIAGAAAFAYRSLSVGSFPAHQTTPAPPSAATERPGVAQPALQQPIAQQPQGEHAAVEPRRIEHPTVGQTLQEPAPPAQSPSPAPPAQSSNPAPPAQNQAPAPPAQSLAPELISALMKRGEQSLALGDIAAARLLFQRAAEVNNPPAAVALGKTYDPAFQVDGANPARAAEWYLRAISLGDQQAADLLKRLVSRQSSSR